MNAPVKVHMPRSSQTNQCRKGNPAGLGPLTRRTLLQHRQAVLGFIVLDAVAMSPYAPAIDLARKIIKSAGLKGNAALTTFALRGSGNLHQSGVLWLTFRP